MMKKFLIAILIVPTVIILASCSNYLNSSDDFYGGDVIDAEMLSSIAESVFASDESLRPDETSAENGVTDAVTETPTDNTNEDAPSDENQGVTEQVTVDAPSDDHTTTEEGTTEEVTTKREHNGVYYWTKSGEVYHKWSDCGHLKNSSEIFSGDITAVTEAGKERLCSTCAKK